MITTQNDAQRYITFFTSGNHKGVSDSTEKNGGAYAGLQPHNLLEAALASGLNIWVRIKKITFLNTGTMTDGNYRNLITVCNTLASCEKRDHENL